jgi:hypothetical protein
MSSDVEGRGHLPEELTARKATLSTWFDPSISLFHSMFPFVSPFPVEQVLDIAIAEGKAREQTAYHIAKSGCDREAGSSGIYPG